MKINKINLAIVLTWFGIPFIYIPAFGAEINFLNLLVSWFFVNLYIVCPVLLILGYIGGGIYSFITMEQGYEDISHRL